MQHTMRHILMADVIESGKKPPAVVQQGLREIVETVNASWGGRILSPLTITLGDEFQGVVDSLHTGVELIFAFERLRLALRQPFELRFVYLYGVVETPLNPERAHGMLGDGLTSARERLTRKQRNRPRFEVVVKDEWQDRLFRDLFTIIESISDRWSIRDYGLIHDLVTMDKIASIAKLHGKQANQIYRRRQTLQTVEYRTMRDLLLEIAKRWDEK